MKKNTLIYFVFALLISLLFADGLQAQDKRNTLKPLNEYNIFPDEYSELDEVPTPTYTKDEVILKTLEKSRQKYLQALILVDRGDTTNAAKYFEEAVKVLNTLVGYPDIDKNEDFSDLAKSLIEDYESFVHNLDHINENSSFFILREKFFQEIESINTGNKPQIQSIVIPKEEPKQTAELQDSKHEETEQKAETREEAMKGIISDFPEKLPEDTMNIFYVPLEENEFVEKNITFLTRKTGRKYFKKWLERGGTWFPMMLRTAEQEGVPDELIYLSMIESGLKPTVVSRAKAVGLWQFIRTTGEAYGLNAKHSVWIDERRDPEKSTRAALKHLKDLYYEFGHWHLALAAYNCGVGCVKRAIRRSDKENPTFWEIRQFLPRETRDYVPLYIAAVKIAKHPEAYYFNPKELDLHDEYKYDAFTLYEPVSTKTLARCAGVTAEEFHNLNPELLKQTTPLDRKEYTIKLPHGRKNEFYSRFASLSKDEKQPWIIHEVGKKESISSIAKKYNISKQEIMDANSIDNSRKNLKTGSELLIPVDKNEFAEQQKESEPVTAQDVAPDNPATDGNYITHAVKSGESLYSIAQRYGVRLTDLRNLNNLAIDDNDLSVGQRLKIALNVPSAETENTDIKKLNKPRIIKHIVKKGESLNQIASLYDISADEIKELNRISDNTIFPGQPLKVKTAVSKNDIDVKKTAKSSSQNNSNLIVHKVKKGEALSTIAALYGVSEDDLRKWNPSKVEGSKIFSGSRLKVYPDVTYKGSSKPKSDKVKKSPKYYTVRKGDTLSTIAQKFGVSIAQIKRKNKSIKGTTIRTGQKIRIQ